MKKESIELMVPLFVALIAFSGGLFAGFMTFENGEDKKILNSNNQNDEQGSNLDDDLDMGDNNKENLDKDIVGPDLGSNFTLCLIINYENGTVDSYNISTDKNTVYDVLIQAADQYDFTVKSTYYGQYGTYFIEKIGSKSNGEDGRYWQYYLNDQYSYVGADLQKVKSNDRIEWKFELTQF